MRLPRPRKPTRRGLAAAVGLLLAAAFLGLGLAQVRVETTVGSFLPADDPASAQLEDFARAFGGDPVVVLLESPQAAQLLDQSHLGPLLGLEGRLSTLPAVATVYGPATVLNQIAGQTQNLLAELSGRRDAVRQQGPRALQEFDARYGPLLVQAMPAGLPTLHNPAFVNSVVFDGNGRPRSQWRFVVPNDHSVAILIRPAQGLDETATARLTDGVRNTVDAAHLPDAKVTVSGVPVLATALSGQVRREVPLIGIAALLAVGACFLVVPWTRRRRRLLPVATTVIAIGMTLAVFGWLDHPLSLGVVAFLSVLLGVGSYYPTYLAHQARRRVVLVVAAGTSASFVTLVLSPLPFVRDLGMSLSMGVLFAVGLGLLAVRLAGPGAATPAAPVPSPPAAAPRGLRFAGVIALTALAVLGWAGLSSFPLETNIENFADGLPALSDARYAESVIGSSGEADVVLTGNNVLSPEAITWMRQAQDGIVAGFGDRARPAISPSSLLGFLGPQPSAEQVSAGVRLLPPYLSGAVFRSDLKMAQLSFGVHMDNIGELRRLRDQMLAGLPPVPAGYHAELTGLPMAAVRGDELVSGQRVLSNVAGIVAAGVVLGIGLRRRGDALRAVVAAAIATGLGLLVLAVTGVPLSPVTAALGSLTAAVGCEFTVVLAAAARSGDRSLRRSVLLATASSAVGYGVLALSGLAVVRDFGILLACSVVLALGSAAGVVWATVRPGSSAAPESALSEEEPDMLAEVTS
ncbi:RND transporter [Amycolatopsis sp. K13G38]|uniref:RND transporter n=1 Tax=Amycolatopsis acididurans TaxID=2724524 RepID=A0ABX1JD65_9PSEU|nr:RND transporter [Amycolatopsis acididurans]NKQ57733.1 RND transporter [Amycolatopsis acididurans]